jgi:hypothetical protein
MRLEDMGQPNPTTWLAYNIYIVVSGLGFGKMILRMGRDLLHSQHCWRGAKDAAREFKFLNFEQLKCKLTRYAKEC